MDADWIDSHNLYTTIRTSWATHLNTPGTQYGITDALGEDTTHTVLSRPALAAIYLQAAVVGICDAILSHGPEHARHVLDAMPVPDPQGFDITRDQLHTAYQWIGHSLTGGNAHTETQITRTLTGSPAPETTAVHHALALLLVGNLAAAPTEPPLPRSDELHTLGTPEGGQEALATINEMLAHLRRSAGLPSGPNTH